jgi:hypothetical protein
VADDLYKYYDEHTVVETEAWDWSRISWPSVTLDIVGIPLSLVGVGSFKPTTRAGARMLFWAGITDSAVSIATANHPIKGLIAFGSAIPVAGAFFNFNLLIWDLSEGTYYIPWTPPIDR